MAHAVPESQGRCRGAGVRRRREREEEPEARGGGRRRRRRRRRRKEEEGAGSRAPGAGRTGAQRPPAAAPRGAGAQLTPRARAGYGRRYRGGGGGGGSPGPARPLAIQRSRFIAQILPQGNGFFSDAAVELAYGEPGKGGLRARSSRANGKARPSRCRKPGALGLRGCARRHSQGLQVRPKTQGQARQGLLKRCICNTLKYP